MEIQLRELEHQIQNKMLRLEDKLEQKGGIKEILGRTGDHLNQNADPGSKEIFNQLIEALKLDVRENSIRITSIEEALRNIKGPSGSSKHTTNQKLEKVLGFMKQNVRREIDIENSGQWSQETNSLKTNNKGPSLEDALKKINDLSIRMTLLEETSMKPKKSGDKRDSIQEDQKVWTKKQKANKARERARRFMSTTTTHGMARIAETDNVWVKIAWAIMVIASVSFGLNNISKTVTDYYKYDPITNIEGKTIQNFTFPTIAICTKRIFTKEYFLNGSLVKAEITFNYSIKDFIDADKSHFNSVRLNLSELEFFEIAQRYGDCVRFHGIKANETLTVNSPSELLSFVFKNNASVSSSEFIQNSNSFYFHVKDIHFNSYMNTERFRAKKYKAYYVNINRAFIETKLGEPLDKTYHQENCIDLCINREIKNKYNCSIPSYFIVDDVEICQKPTIFNNVYNIPSNYFDDDLFYSYEEITNSYGTNLENLAVEFQNECEDICPRECTSSRFSVQSINSADGLSYTELNIAVSDFSTLEISQIPKMSSFDLVSSMGGTLGLCVGISFLSFVEIFEFLFDVLLILLIER